MNRKHVRHYPTPSIKSSQEEQYEEFSRDWHQKARVLQARRWRALKHEIKGG